MLFSVAILVMLWLMQIVFINVFYQGMKTQNTTDAAKGIVALYSQLQGTALKEKLNSIANDKDVFVNITDKDGKSLYVMNPVGRDYGTPVENMGRPPEGQFGNGNGSGQSPSGSIDNPGKLFQGISFADLAKKVLAQPNGELAYSFDDVQNRKMLLYGKVIHSPDGGSAILIVSSPLQPLTETVRILERQLVYITIVIFVMALGISILIAQSVSRPITRITGKAKLLAKGKYDMTFDHGRYTEVNQLADTLNYATGALQQVESLRNELIANVSHDLRTPLTMIKIYAEMIRDLNGENSKKRDQNVAVIIEESDRLTSLVQNLLDLSKLQSGVMPYQPAVFDLTQSVKRILPRYDALVQKDGYHFKFKQQGEVLVNADEARIEQVLYNLLNNAINYAGTDKEIAVSIVDYNKTVRVSVSDNGEGIAPENIEFIWDRYYKVDKEHRRAAAGSGLGLSIVKSILDLHGMKYGVNSVLGQGATFWFELEKA
jgi:signal transduction histidine kinase